ncbi:MAG: VaFE repeat-containing surface-anchored protein, partial [Bacteroidales bacterium]|nr:VaFE repeat-containing surface-anchored protein [Bacteroidales bacterium]
TALAEDTNDHITNADEEVTIIDTVFYRGLKPNTKYEVTGTLMDKESGEKIFDAEGKEITRPVVVRHIKRCPFRHIT